MERPKPEIEVGLQVSVEQPADGSFLVAASGELDLSNSKSLEDAVSAARDRGARSLVLDLSGLTFMDSSGLRLLIDTWNEANVADRTLSIVVRAGGLVRRLLEITGCDAVLPIVEDAAG